MTFQAATSSVLVTCMYQVQPYTDFSLQTRIPPVMYSMNNVHASSMKGISADNGGTDTTNYSNQTGECTKISSVQERQESILKQLKEMKVELLSIAEKVGANLKISKCQPAQITECVPMPYEPYDIVISCEPGRPPIAAFLFYHLLKDHGFTVATPIYYHSSLQEPVPKQWIKCVNPTSALKQGREQLIMTFIWRKDPFGPSLIVSPKSQSQIKGTNNIARFLARQFQPMLYEGNGPEAAAQIDSLLDGAGLQLSYGSAKEKASAVRNLNAQLGGADWLIGDHMTLADVCLWSALVEDSTIKLDSLPKNIKKWFQHCSSSKVFSHVADTLGFKMF